MQRRLEVHLSLAFHRYLERKAVHIHLDQQLIGTPEHGINVETRPLNPFAYPRSGAPEYPKTFIISIAGVGDVEAEAHVWPPNSDLSEYKLGHKAAARQGFYSYRSDRLIQAGGWNDVVQHDTEPRNSLARVKFDLPPELDTRFGLNVQKCAVVAQARFEAAVQRCRSCDGTSFDTFRIKAQSVYRKQDNNSSKLLSAVPGKGLPKKLRRGAEHIVDPNATGVREIDFSWEEMPAKLVVDIDRANKTIRLNRSYRRILLRGLPASGTDLPLLKTLLYLLPEDEFLANRVTAKRRTRLSNINELLLQTLLTSRG